MPFVTSHQKDLKRQLGCVFLFPFGFDRTKKAQPFCIFFFLFFLIIIIMTIIFKNNFNMIIIETLLNFNLKIYWIMNNEKITFKI